ncbi:MAG TPA: hypothetical protein VFQ76_12370, partial [Longimicrobiaceae bacterium]|nr:hypothetical protein [Longimicrobiaceae bacterium]
MGRRRREFLAGAAVGVGAALLSAFFFVAFVAPGWPRTLWGWLISAALGLPLLVVGEVVLALCFQLGPPRFHRVLRQTPWGVQAFRYPSGSRAG